MRSIFQVLGNWLGWLHKSRRTYQCRHHNGSLHRHMIHLHIPKDLPRSHPAQLDYPADISPGARVEVYHVFTVVIHHWKTNGWNLKISPFKKSHLNQTSIFFGFPAVSFTVVIQRWVLCVKLTVFLPSTLSICDSIDERNRRRSA